MKWIKETNSCQISALNFTLTTQIITKNNLSLGANDWQTSCPYSSLNRQAERQEIAAVPEQGTCAVSREGWQGEPKHTWETFAAWRAESWCKEGSVDTTLKVSSSFVFVPELGAVEVGQLKEQKNHHGPRGVSHHLLGYRHSGSSSNQVRLASWAVVLDTPGVWRYSAIRESCRQRQGIKKWVNLQSEERGAWVWRWSRWSNMYPQISTLELLGKV